MVRFGIEEEFLLLDQTALVPLAMAHGTRERFARLPGGGIVTAEYLTSQLETATAPLSTRDEAAEQLRDLRALVGRLASEQAAIAAPTGNPFATTRSPIISPSPHYDDVALRLGHLTREHEVNGLHVHIEVAEEEDRVRVLNRLRGWLPALSALTGNSPFANGLDTAFASWRSILIRRLASSWCPPRFHDIDDYRSRLQQLIDLGSIGEPSSVSWAVRVSERFPTVEVRVFDVPLDPDDSVLAALLCRAIAQSEDGPLPHDGVDAIDESLWSAARFGMSGRLFDPTTGEVRGAWDVVERMREACAPALRESGDAEYVTEGLARIREHGTGAERQRRAFAQDGIPGLAALLHAGTADR